ncbi:PBECR2 nuclease fold domain-containing protein [Paracoccus contaminans]|uniref:PBECR2 nuclease fold domain-containing protein n=1 Tax=Paracoccus contaminans TaxID=1945662 RepID=UPI0012F4CBFF|nr:PBECR2 nuclease fold domain-containing protein [Paracoccus contaminans]
MKHVCFAEADHPVRRAADQLIALLAPIGEARLRAVRTAVLADGADEAMRNLLELAAIWTPDAQAHHIGKALELMALTGRGEVLDELAETAGFAGEAEGIGQSFDEQLAFLKQKQPQQTDTWTDLMRGQHDRAFVIAGAKDAAMLDDFFTAVQQAATDWDRDAFAARFDEIVDKYGWSYNGGREWRIRTIFETNLRTSYMAGRLKQMRAPAVVKMRPYWQYRHGENGTPLNPRPQHVSWDGLVLMHDDPWWDVHFPPNDWLCSCGVRTLSERDLARLKKTGPDLAPETRTRPIVDRQTGKVIDQPDGVGYGWDYAPGDHWTKGLVPSVLIKEGTERAGKSIVAIDQPSPLDQLIAARRPLPPQPAVFDFASFDPAFGFDEEGYEAAAQFLNAFGLSAMDQERLVEDVAGHRIAISADLFRQRDGTSKTGKRDRTSFTPWLPHAILDPDEIWLQVRRDDAGRMIVGRTYVRVAEIDGETHGLVAGFELAGKWWSPNTTHISADRKGPNVQALKPKRSGKLIWCRSRK